MIPCKPIIKQLHELIVKSNLIDSCIPGRRLTKINLEDKWNLRSLEKLIVGFAVEVFKKMKKSN